MKIEATPADLSPIFRVVFRASVWLNRGTEYRNLGKYDEAIKHFEKVIKETDINIKNDTLYINKGNAFYYLEKYDDAIKYYDKAIALNANNAVAWANRCAAFGGLEKYD